MSSHLAQSLTPYFLSCDFSLGVYKIKVQLTGFSSLVEKIHSLGMHFRLVDICAIDNSKRNKKNDHDFSVHYHLLNLDDFNRVIIIVDLNLDQALPSLCKYYKLAKNFQDEVFDLFGIKFIYENKQDNLRIYTKGNVLGHPLRKDFLKNQSLGEIITKPRDLDNRIKLNLNHPIQNSNANIDFFINDGVIEDTEIQIGNKHIGIEKLLENNDHNLNLSLMGKLNSLCAFNHSLVYIKTLEEFNNINIPQKARALRMLFSELARILEHFHCIGLWAYELGVINIYKDCTNAKEQIYKLFYKYNSWRDGSHLLCVGGMRQDVPSGWHLKCIEVVSFLRKVLTDIKNLLGDSRDWFERGQVGKLDPSDALIYGHSGPNLRASGINYDVRKRFPYYFYNEVDFEIPLGSEGKNFDRYMVRVEEVYQSMSILIQLIDGLPSGEYQNKDVDNENFRAGELYSSIESAGGELGVYLVNEVENRPYRLHIVAPNIGYTLSYKSLVQNLAPEDAGHVYRSFNINVSEIER